MQSCRNQRNSLPWPPVSRSYPSAGCVQATAVAEHPAVGFVIATGHPGCGRRFEFDDPSANQSIYRHRKNGRGWPLFPTHRSTAKCAPKGRYLSAPITAHGVLSPEESSSLESSAASSAAVTTCLNADGWRGPAPSFRSRGRIEETRRVQGVGNFRPARQSRGGRLDDYVISGEPHAEIPAFIEGVPYSNPGIQPLRRDSVGSGSTGSACVILKFWRMVFH